MRTCRRWILGVALVGALVLVSASGASALTATVHIQEAAIRMQQDERREHPAWRWPVDGPREVAVPYRAPAHEYGAGHRGIDVPVSPGAAIRAPADGVIAFRGVVVDRPLITIEHPDGYVTTFEPLSSALSPGDVVSEGDVVGAVDVGGHSSPGTLHIGVRLDGAYINPMLLFGDVPRAILLPCCAPP